MQRIEWLLATNGHCLFGIEELIAALVTSIGVEAGTAGTVASIATPALIGAGGGAALGAITGEGALRGAEFGGLAGFGGGLGAAVGPAVGIGATAGGAIGGAAGGALGGEVTGTNPLLGAVGGGIGGALTGSLAPTAAEIGTAAPGAVAPTEVTGGAGMSGGGGPSAATTEIPGSLTGPPEGATVQTNVVGAPGDTGGPVSGAPTPLVSGDYTGGTPYTAPSGEIITPPAQTFDISGGSVDPGLATRLQAGAGARANLESNIAAGNPDFANFTANPADRGILGDIGQYIKDNPLQALGVAGSGGMLLSQALRPNPYQTQLNQLEQARTGASTMATALETPLFTGVLPPGQAQAVDRATANRKAQVRSAYVNAGMPGSTAEAEALGAIDADAGARKVGIAENLFNKAAGYTNMSTNDIQTILREKQNEDAALQTALSRFVAALAGSRGGGGTGTSAA